jgi:hypothetical protein
MGRSRFPLAPQAPSPKTSPTASTVTRNLPLWREFIIRGIYPRLLALEIVPSTADLPASHAEEHEGQANPFYPDGPRKLQL